MSLFELDRLTDNSRKGRKVIVPKKKKRELRLKCDAKGFWKS